MTRLPARSSLWAVAGALLLGCAGSVSAAEKGQIQFNRDVRPILSDSCFLCHGPDKNQRKGKLRLDDREAALSPRRWLNRLGLYGLEIIGANAYMYRKKHLQAQQNKERGSKVNTSEA